MTIQFENIEYLRTGTEKQRRVYDALTESKILIILQKFDPILVGTIPINIDIESSDLDILCYFKDPREFLQIIQDGFCKAEGFKIRQLSLQELNTVIVNFKVGDFEVEIFGQGIPSKQQLAYRHMLIEYKLLCERDESFRQQIIDLKRKGYKTEPAFGMVLGLSGNPYTELLTFESK